VGGESNDAASGPKKETPDKKQLQQTEILGQMEKEKKEELPGKQKEEPPEEKTVLSRWEIARYLNLYAEEGFYPLHREKLPLFIRTDVDGDGSEEILAIYVDQENSKAIRLDKLSDISRIYDEQYTPFLVELWIFSTKDAVLVPAKRISLGKHRVIEAVDNFSLRKDQPSPFVVSVRFQKHEGFEEKWIIFYNNKISRFALEETFTKQHRLKDIDDDGVKDLLLYEKIFEEGTGFETFITWYKWNGENIIEHNTINVVRNLRTFLSEVHNLLKEEQYREFIEYALLPERVEQLREKDLTDSEITRRAIQLRDPAEEEKSPLQTQEKEIMDIIYPEIMENPFALPDDKGAYFPLQMRVITEESNYLYEATVAMPENPFTGKQFYFLLSVADR
jgi:hypothetical protein